MDILSVSQTSPADAPPPEPPSGDMPEPTTDWSPAHSAAHYRVADWADGYFAVNPSGHVVVRTGGDAAHEIDLLEVVEGLRERDLHPPLVLHFTDILDDRLRRLHDAFAAAIRENEYRGSYAAVYPIKVNQHRAVVESVFRAGGPYHFGLEVGSKSELLVVMAVSCEAPDRLIICNGFKDDGYIEAVILASKLGRRIIPVIESTRELDLILKYAAKYDVRPDIGVRVKLTARGAGRWSASIGERAKFGLHYSEVLAMYERLRAEGFGDCLKLVHCHAGSQIQDINALKNAVNELAQVYGELAELGARLEFIDVGGGLGVDYDGSQSNTDHSINYSLEEYASNVVYRVASICNERGIAHPTIVSESGRAIATYQSVLVVDVLGESRPGNLADRLDLEQVSASAEAAEHQPLRDLIEACQYVAPERLEECYHDAVQAREQVLQLFALGYLNLRAAAFAEQLFWATCNKIRDLCGPEDELVEELAELRSRLCANYFCNFSVFQSLPDVWAIDKVFPIMPIHRLEEKPTQPAVLADLTCDSDGKINHFIGDGEAEPTIDLHALRSGEPYYLGVFLIGAYQDILGDLHNLFGDNHVAHIRADEGGWHIEDYVKGDTAGDVLGYVQYDTKRLYGQLDRDCEKAVRTGRLTLADRRALLRFYESALGSYTYLESR